MKTDTFWFRLVLSAAVLWLAFWGYQSVSHYSATKAVALSYSRDLSRYDRCEMSRLDEASTASEWKFRNSTFSEVQECRWLMDEAERKAKAEQSLWEKLVNERRVVSYFFYRGLIPAGIVLLVVAGWDWATLVLGRYVNWLKTGTANQGSD